MATTYVYTDRESRIYPDPGIGEVSKGDEREFTQDSAPDDGRWEPKAGAKPRKAAPKPTTSDASPAPDSADEQSSDKTPDADAETGDGETAPEEK